jgi:hypothetical protein
VRLQHEGRNAEPAAIAPMSAPVERPAKDGALWKGAGVGGPCSTVDLLGAKVQLSHTNCDLLPQGAEHTLATAPSAGHRKLQAKPLVAELRETCHVARFSSNKSELASLEWGPHVYGSQTSTKCLGLHAK